MKYPFLFVLMSCFSLFCDAQKAVDLPPEITFHRYQSIFSITGYESYYMLGDQTVTDQELGRYLEVNAPIIGKPYQKGLKLRRKARHFAALGVAGAALGLLTKSRQLDYIGYSGFVLGSTAGLSLTAWGNRKMGEGVYLYNLDRHRRLKEIHKRQPQYENPKNYSVIDGKQ